jgi:hypothetical protein
LTTLIGAEVKRAQEFIFTFTPTHLNHSNICTFITQHPFNFTCRGA